MKNKFLYLIIFAAIVVILILFFRKNDSVIGNEKILNEIDSLLLPLSSDNITESDFDDLKFMVKTDSYASDEVDEMILLAKYKEYSHIGHSLGFLHNYIKSGKKPICPGHSLAHYYIFTRHDEVDAASDVLEESRSQFTVWSSSMLSVDNPNIKRNNAFASLFNSILFKIDHGNNIASDEEISRLAEAPCA